jgi:hypothetical protein
MNEQERQQVRAEVLDEVDAILLDKSRWGERTITTTASRVIREEVKP